MVNAKYVLIWLGVFLFYCFVFQGMISLFAWLVDDDPATVAIPLLIASVALLYTDRNVDTYIRLFKKPKA